MFSYDALRHLTEVKDWLGITSIVNDSLGRTTEVIYPDNRKVSYTYNSLNQRTGITYPDGKQVSYTFDENARLSELVTINKEESKYDASNIYRYIANVLPLYYNYNVITIKEAILWQV